MKTLSEIVAQARDKYTVHECGECTYRKCCELGFGSAECLSRRASISLMLGIEDGLFTKILDDIEAAWRWEKSEIEANALAVGGIVEEARHTPGNAAALRDALIKALTLIHVCDWPPGVSLDGVVEVIREIDSALDKPPRQCDVGTAEEQRVRFESFCKRNGDGFSASAYCAYECPCGNKGDCKLEWEQMPYTEEEVGAE